MGRGTGFFAGALGQDIEWGASRRRPSQRNRRPFTREPPRLEPHQKTSLKSFHTSLDIPLNYVGCLIIIVNLDLL